MPDTTFKFPGTAAGDRTVASSTDNWQFADNIKLDDASGATVDTDTEGDRSAGLAATNFDFSVIPSGSTIDGIEVRVGDYSESGAGSCEWQFLIKAGCMLILADDSDGDENKQDELSDPTAIIQTDEAGGSSDLWTETITRANVQDSDWGFYVGVDEINAPGSVVDIDYLKMRVFYTLGEMLTVTGTIVGATESQVQAGGRTIILDLAGGPEWLATGGPFDGSRQGIIDGLTSSQTETLGWDNEVVGTMGLTQIVRTSNTKVTITLLAAETADYKITVDEFITATMVSSLHTGGDTLFHPNFTTILFECDQTLAPDSIITQTNLSGSITDIDEPVDSPDSNWLLVA